MLNTQAGGHISSRENQERALAAESTSPPRQFLFQPAVVLFISLATAVCLSLYLLRESIGGSSSFRFPPSFFYVVPIIVPFVAFLFDRAEHIRRRPAVALIVDIVVIGFSMARVFTNIVPVSGHTLFLTYAIFGSRSLVVVVTASLVMLQVIYLKYFVWHDAVTSTTGIIAGGIAAYVVNRVVRNLMKEPNDA